MGASYPAAILVAEIRKPTDYGERYVQSKSKEDKTARAIEEVRRWKQEGRKGKITLHFDGSGVVSKLECSVFI